MAAATGVKFEPPTLDLTVDRYSAFKAWHDRWNDYAIVTKLKDEAAEYQCSMLRYTFTEETRKIYNTLNLSADEAKDIKEILKKLEAFAKGTVNETLERHTFNSQKQDEDECFDDFLTDLKVLIKNCDYCANCVDGVLRDRIVAGIRDLSLRQKLLSENDLTLKKAEDACRAREKAVQGAKLLNKDEKRESAKVDEVTRRRSNERQFRPPQNNRDNLNNSNIMFRRPQNKDRVATGRPCKFCTNGSRWYA